MHLEWQTITQPEYRVQLYIPAPEQVWQTYRQAKAQDDAATLPYWARLWPAALAMGSFLVRYPQYVKGKQVLELAAGLGLPSLIAAGYAQTVCCSDYLPEAVSVMHESVTRNGFSNVHCRLLNWHHLPAGLQAEVLILSDINYDTAEFDQLFQVLQQFLQKSTTILLSTPQRLMGKPFIERLLPWCMAQEEIAVLHQSQENFISVFALKKES